MSEDFTGQNTSHLLQWASPWVPQNFTEINAPEVLVRTQGQARYKDYSRAALCGETDLAVLIVLSNV